MDSKKSVILLLGILLIILFSFSVDAKIAIYNYCDFSNTQCDDIEESMELLLEVYSHDLEYYYVHLPSGGQDSVFSSIATECARDQGMFEEMKDLLYDNNEDLSRDALKGYAEDLGLTMANFSFCLDIREKEFVVKEDVDYAEDRGIVNAPTVVIKDESFGYLDYEGYKEIVEEKLGLVVEEVVVEEEIVVEEVVLVVVEEEEVCEGCVFDEVCMEPGWIIREYYCDNDNQVKLQKQDKSTCEASFECYSGICENSVCKSGENDFVMNLFDWFFALF